VFRGTMPHFLAHLVAIALMVAFPDIVRWLPARM
jgi:TRAP-type mannitol/chloroaromatic compound transport system permease large subunit